MTMFDYLSNSQHPNIKKVEAILLVIPGCNTSTCYDQFLASKIQPHLLIHVPIDTNKFVFCVSERFLIISKSSLQTGTRWTR